MNLPDLYRTSHIRAIEQQHGAEGLMEKAGLAVADLACTLANADTPDLLILAGPGNNGGDAFVAARHLKTRSKKIHLVFTGNAAELPHDARAAYADWLACGGTVVSQIPAGASFGLILDGLFGIGLTRPLEGLYARLINAVNQIQAPRLAIDIPSGLCADTGRILGTAIRADHTLTFIGLKPGLYTLDGVDTAGQVRLADLGIQPAPSNGRLVDRLPYPLPARKNNSHKGSYGSVAVIGGAQGMVGAAFLASRAALLAGSGRVYCHLLATDAPLLDMETPELMLRNANIGNVATDVNALVVGPGMGRLPKGAEILKSSLQRATPLLLDADALHLIANDSPLATALKQRGNAVLTPHPGEAAALLHCDSASIQADRIQAACSIANRYNAVTVLKGAGSVIATPDERWFINHSGNPGLAAAGMGDVLAGIIGGLIAQGLSVEQATLSGVYLHGLAADNLNTRIGLTASEVASEVRNILNKNNS